MAANENTKFQINYKLSDGTLINLYATDVKDLETGLNDLVWWHHLSRQQVLTLVVATLLLLQYQTFKRSSLQHQLLLQ